MENGVLPKIFLDFLNIRHLPSVPKTESCGWVKAVAAMLNTRCMRGLFFKIKMYVGQYGPTLIWDLNSFSFSQVFRHRIAGIQVCFYLCCSIQQVQLVCSLLEKVKPGHTVSPALPPIIPVVVMQHFADCTSPSDFCSIFIFLANCHTSRSCCFWGTRTCCHLHMVSPAACWSTTGLSHSVPPYFRLKKHLFFGPLYFLSISFSPDTFSNVVIEGVIHGVFYPHHQPR